MSTPFQLVWSDESNNLVLDASFPVAFPGVTTKPQYIQLKSNAIPLSTFNTLTNVGIYLTGDADDLDVVQNIWPTLGDSNRPELKGGLDISFDFGRTYTRFDPTHGLESDKSTYIALPVTAIGAQGQDGTLTAFESAHFVIRFVIPPGTTIYRRLDVRLGVSADII